MNNSINKILVFIIVVTTSAIGCTTTLNRESVNCIERILNVEVVRIDEKNHRYFIVSKEIKALDVKNKINIMDKCFSNTPWQRDWALSVFTEAKYAGYKDEQKIIPYHIDNTWAAAYTVEYDHFTKSLIKNPATNPEQLMP
ncbi:MAG: hypothetical protein ABFS39_11440 [Pseudomonadota bacterium]